MIYDFLFGSFFIWWKLKFFLLEFHFHAGTLTKQALDGIIGCKINLTPFAYEVDFRICRSKLVMDRVLEVPWINGFKASWAKIFSIICWYIWWFFKMECAPKSLQFFEKPLKQMMPKIVRKLKTRKAFTWNPLSWVKPIN